MSILDQDETRRRISEKLMYELGPVYELLQDPRVTDIMLNPDGQLWVERLGEEKELCGRMESIKVFGLMNTIASELNVEHTAKNPILECELPLDGSRFSGMLPPIVEGPSFSIRKRALLVFSLQDYCDEGIMTQAQREFIEQAVRARKNILIAGGTGSGKTTLTNAVVQYIVEASPNHRVFVIEDTRELQCAALNKKMMKTAPNVSMTDLLNASMRHFPDRFVIGEVRDGFALLTLLKTWMTGHPGGAATIHANNAQDTLVKIELLLKEAVLGDVRSLVAAAINVVVFIEKCCGVGRKVTEILQVDGHDGQNYQTQLIGENNV